MFHSTVSRVFFAICPPLPLARRITAAAHWFGGAGVLRPEHLHVTLDILDDMASLERDRVRRLIAAGDAVAAAPFTLTLDRAGGSARSIALRPRLRVDGLEALHREIASRRRGAGLAERAGYRFSPHLTLGYRDGTPFSEPVAPVEWAVRDFVLIHSLVGRTRHDVIGRWPLTGEDSTQFELF